MFLKYITIQIFNVLRSVKHDFYLELFLICQIKFKGLHFDLYF